MVSDIDLFSSSLVSLLVCNMLREGLLHLAVLDVSSFGFLAILNQTLALLHLKDQSLTVCTGLESSGSWNYRSLLYPATLVQEFKDQNYRMRRVTVDEQIQYLGAEYNRMLRLSELHGDSCDIRGLDG